MPYNVSVRGTPMPRPHLDQLIESLEFLATVKPSTTLDQALPVVDAVFTLHGGSRGDAVRVDDLLAKAKQL